VDHRSFDYDFIVIGSGFGRSVSAFRLSEKGYRVAVLEIGRLWTAADFPKTNKKLRNFPVHPAEARAGVE
jgi:cholesterol oxidase